MSGSKNIAVKFIVPMIGSWIINPVGVSLLYIFGLGNDKYLVTIMITTSACGPIQMIFNEYLASAVTNRLFEPKLSQIFLLLMFQFFACLLTTLFLTGRDFDVLSFNEQLVIIAFLTLSTYLTYLCAVIFYHLVATNKVSKKQSMIVGVLPGFVSILIYLISGILRDGSLLILNIILPVVVQLFFLRKLYDEVGAILIKMKNKSAPKNKTIIPLMLLLTFIALISSDLRESLAALNLKYCSLILIFLNVISSLIITVNRSNYLGAKKIYNLDQRYLLLTLLSISIIAICFNSQIINKILIFSVLQLLVIQAIQYVRKNDSKDLSLIDYQP